ncbi:MAG: immunity 26/phosphotriesterase HocA family protein [Prosthecobacter sp.]
MLKRPKFKPGEILVIPLSEHSFGYAQVIRDDDFGCFIRVFDHLTKEICPIEELQGGLKVKDRAYVNNSSARGRWKHLGFAPLRAEDEKMPTLFYGSSCSCWTVQNENKPEQYIKGESTNRAALRSKGYTHKVLWLAKDFEDLLQHNTPLIWPGSD